MPSFIKAMRDFYFDQFGLAPFFSSGALRALRAENDEQKHQLRGMPMLRLISYSAVIERDDKMLIEQSEIPFTIADKRVFVPLSLLQYGDNHAKTDRAMSQIMTLGKADPIEIELPSGYALANGLPLPASETGINSNPVNALAEAHARQPERGASAAMITGGATGGAAITYPDGRKEAIADTVSSISDARTVNNVMRHNYRVLSDGEKQQMKSIKDEGLGLVQLLHEIGGTDPTGDRHASRELSLAQTKIEEAVMWVEKHITR